MYPIYIGYIYIYPIEEKLPVYGITTHHSNRHVRLGEVPTINKSITVNKNTSGRKSFCLTSPALHYNASLHTESIKLQCTVLQKRQLDSDTI